MLEQLLPLNVFAFFLVFARVGAAMLLLPAIGETFVSVRARLGLALLLTLVALPPLLPKLPAMPAAPVELALLVLGELVVGLFIGTVARMFISALTTAGMIAAYSTSLANALVNDPATAQQASIAGSFFTITALMLIFALNLHHLMIAAVIDSYTLFQPGQALPIGDFSDIMARVVSQTFLLAVKMSAPFIAVSGIFYLGLGLLARLMPQVQVFFIAIPLQVAIGLLVLALSLPVLLGVFVGALEETMSNFLVL